MGGFEASIDIVCCHVFTDSVVAAAFDATNKQRWIVRTILVRFTHVKDV